jgi:hypothetical protein
MGKLFQEHTDLGCEGCGHVFQLGDSVYILHLGMTRRDYCRLCKEKVVAFLDALQLHVSQQQVPVTEAATQPSNHEANHHN